MNYAKIAPEIMNPIYQSYQAIHESDINPTLLVLLELRVSQLNGCAYCCELHASQGRKLNIPSFVVTK